MANIMNMFPGGGGGEATVYTGSVAFSAQPVRASSSVGFKPLMVSFSGSTAGATNHPSGWVIWNEDGSIRSQDCIGNTITAATNTDTGFSITFGANFSGAMSFAAVRW